MNFLKKIFSKKRKQPEKADWLAAGLGNPGRKYENTRHNIGWMCALETARRYNAPIRSESTIYHHTHFNIEDNTVFLAIPTTYMNKSGEAVCKIAAEYSIPPEKIIIIFDEINFPPGKLHLKFGGSSGGHNGVQSVINELGTSDFYRLRCGIGKDFPPGGMVDYVLSPFGKDEMPEAAKMINRCPDCIEILIRSGKRRAMTEINSGRLWD